MSVLTWIDLIMAKIVIFMFSHDISIPPTCTIFFFTILSLS